MNPGHRLVLQEPAKVQFALPWTSLAFQVEWIRCGSLFLSEFGSEFSSVKNLFQTKLVHENASSCSLAEEKRTHNLPGGLFLLAMCVCFSICIIYSLQPFHSGSQALVYSSPVPAASSTHKSSAALPCSLDTPGLCHHPECHSKEHLPHEPVRVLEHAAYLRPHLDQS